ncbi:MAG: Gfo/Idh/MocA family oxidoreductase, partial [Chitinophagaceae bacterium]|nr:Gfo/Idh/MocA family oxidoreductase [Chitinophagaceae bacterium]
MDKIRWGILGCGRIARKFASDLKLVDDGILVAIGSRSEASATAFATEFPVEHIHHSYEALVTNPAVDIIYIASPHSFHHEHTMLCLNHNKPVLCEKAFALNARDAKEMIRTAQSKQLFLMEALWTKFMPHYQLLMEYVKTGKLGEIQNVLINFGFAPTVPIPQRLFDPALGGGSLLDIGIYNVFIALSVLGKPDAMDVRMSFVPTGVDEQASILFRYKNGAMAQLFSSFSSNLATEADISGRGGRI